MAPPKRFPQKKEEFGADERVSYYEEDGKWILEDEKGEEWEWVEETGKWVPALSADEVKQYQQAYGAGATDDGLTAEEEFKKRKREITEQTKNEPNKKAKADKPSTAIYVTSIPLDATLDEIHQVFSRCGMIAEEIDSDGPRIKMYKDDEGNFKGDALIIFFRPESINQAMILLDESDFRPGVKGPDGPMRISIADDSYKKTKQEGGGGGDKAGGGSGTSTPMRRGRKGDKQKIIEKTARLNQRLADWSDDEDGGALLNREIKKEVRKTNRFDKIVVLKHMFTPESLAEELKEDPEVKEFLLEDVKEKCEEVTGAQVLDLFLFDLEEEGVMTVRFADAEAAEKCVNSLHGFVFDGRKVDASISTGQKFRKSEADEEEERKRLDAFAESLENAPDT